MKRFVVFVHVAVLAVLTPGLLLGGKMGTVSRRICGLMALAVLLSGVAIQAKVIVVTTTIQAAVNAASPGDGRLRPARNLPRERSGDQVGNHH
jgi:hypothetical protein